MLKTGHFHPAVIFLILINTHLSEASLCGYYDNYCGWNIFGIIFVIIVTVIAISCLCNCFNESCVTTEDFDIEIPTKDETPPFNLRNETVNMNQVQNQAVYDYEILPQPLPKFELPTRPAIQDNPQNGISTALPSAPHAYSENSNRTCQGHTNCQNSPQPLLRFHEPPRISGSTNQYNTHNELTSMLSSTSPLDSDPPAYSEIFNGESESTYQSPV